MTLLPNTVYRFRVSSSLGFCVHPYSLSNCWASECDAVEEVCWFDPGVPAGVCVPYCRLYRLATPVNDFCSQQSSTLCPHPVSAEIQAAQKPVSWSVLPGVRTLDVCWLHFSLSILMEKLRTGSFHPVFSVSVREQGLGESVTWIFLLGSLWLMSSLPGVLESFSGF